MKTYLKNTIFILLDILLLVVVFYLSIYVRESIDSSHLPSFNKVELSNFFFVFVVLILLMYYEKVYTFNYDFWQDTLKIIKSFIIGYFIVLSVLTLTKNSIEFSRLFISIYFLFGMVLLPIYKRFIKRLFYSFDFFKKKVLVVGSKEQIEIFKKEFEENWYIGQTYTKGRYEAVIIATKETSVNEINNLVSKYLNLCSELYIVPYIVDIDFSSSNILEYSNIRHNAIQIENKLLSKKNIFIKIVFDKVLSMLILPLFLFLHFIISFMIRLDSKGKILFKQKRLGKNDKEFKVYKYRSMYENGDNILQEYLNNNPDEVEHYEKYHKYKNDPRITRVGKLLRNTSLDELPQFINVLKGEMSIVGPRPYMLNELEKLGYYKNSLVKVKPGITGLWQVSGRNNLTFEQRKELDIWYIKNWSLWADLIILIKTIKVVLGKIGAK